MGQDGGYSGYEEDLDFPAEVVEVFVPFIPISILHKYTIISSRYISTTGENGSLLEVGKGSGDRKIYDRKKLASYILTHLINSLIPIRTVHTLAKKSRFVGLPLIDRAVSEVSRNKLLQSGGVLDFESEWFDRMPDGSNGDGAINGEFPDNDSGDLSTMDSGGTLTGEIDSSYGLGRLKSIFKKVFSELGEERIGQMEMAKAVFSTFRDSGFLVAEAGTGTGKSLAYLVPAILHSLANEKRILISTFTKNLQNQLFGRDIPITERVMGVNVKVARLMGRENYICPDRVMRNLRRIEEPSVALNLALAVIMSDEGLIYSLNEENISLDKKITAPARCFMGRCFYAERCPLMIARERALKADIVLVNHSLVMTDYRSGGAMLGDYSAIVFDEAHNLEKAVIETLSIALNRELLRDILEPLDFVRPDDERWKFIKTALPSNAKNLGSEISLGVKSLYKAFDELFEKISELLNPDGSYAGTRVRYLDGSETFADVKADIIGYLFEINRLKNLLNVLCEVEFPPDLEQLKSEVLFVNDGLEELSATMEFLTGNGDDEYVFWLEWDSRGKLSEIASSPIFVNREFADFIESKCESVIFTSATLSQGGSFSYFEKKLGLDRSGFKGNRISLPSPFPFEKNCGIFIATDCIDPNEDSFTDQVAYEVEEIALRVTRRMLVLFTSYRLCNATIEKLSSSEVADRLIVQGMGESRETITERFRMSEAGILMGVASFWEGVDLPGEELEVLVITKLPFPVPTEPIIQARSERLEARGENPFELLHLPEAALRLKQGVGRLIRRKDDRGVVVILDSRLFFKRYGKTIIDELPVSNVEFLSYRDIPSKVGEWFTD